MKVRRSLILPSSMTPGGNPKEDFIVSPFRILRYFNDESVISKPPTSGDGFKNFNNFRRVSFPIVRYRSPLTYADFTQTYAEKFLRSSAFILRRSALLRSKTSIEARLP